MCTKLLADVEDQADQPKWRSRAAAVSRLTQQMHYRWRRLMLRRSYRGADNLLRRAELESIPHSFAKHPLLRSGGTNSKQYARLARFITGHFPHGAFREHFHKDGPIACPCDPSGRTVETRHHILYDCPFWIRPDLPPPKPVPLRRKLQIVKRKFGELRLLDEQAYASWEHVQRFLAWNPLTATFEWGELCEIAAHAVAACERGDEYWATPEYLYFYLMTNRHHALARWLQVARQDRIRDSKDRLKPAAFNSWWRKHMRLELLIPWWIGQLNPDLGPLATGGFSDGFDRIITMGNMGISRAEEAARERRLLRAFEQLKSDQGPDFLVTAENIAGLGGDGGLHAEDLSDLESEHSARSPSPVSSAEDATLWRPFDPLADDDAPIRGPRMTFDRRFTHYAGHEQDAVATRESRRKARGATIMAPLTLSMDYGIRDLRHPPEKCKEASVRSGHAPRDAPANKSASPQPCHLP